MTNYQCDTDFENKLTRINYRFILNIVSKIQELRLCAYSLTQFNVTIDNYLLRSRKEVEQHEKKSIQ